MGKLTLKKNILTESDEDAALKAKNKANNRKNYIIIIAAVFAILSIITVRTVFENIAEYKKVAAANAWSISLEVGSVLAIIDPIEEPFAISWDPETKILTLPVKEGGKPIERYLPLTDGTKLIFTAEEDNIVRETFMYCVAVEYKGMQAYHNSKEPVTSCADNKY